MMSGAPETSPAVRICRPATRMIITRSMGDEQSPRPRLLEPALADRLKRMPIVILTGARQVGKTTLARSSR